MPTMPSTLSPGPPGAMCSAVQFLCSRSRSCPPCWTRHLDHSPRVTHMTRYIVRRLLGMIPLLIGISFLVFALLNLVPGSPTDQFEFNPNIKPADLARIKSNLGLDAPWYE